MVKGLTTAALKSGYILGIAAVLSARPSGGWRQSVGFERSPVFESRPFRRESNCCLFWPRSGVGVAALSPDSLNSRLRRVTDARRIIAAMTTIEQDGSRKHARASGMQVGLRRAQVLVPGEFLRDHRVPRVLGRPRAELVT